MSKVSCITPTYRRFHCIERSITFFLAQETTLEKELIIMNTDEVYPLELDDTFTDEEKSQIKIINNNIDYQTHLAYESTGAIRRDAFNHANGDYYITWDDDDIFLPWNIQQCFDGILRNNSEAWKPFYSFMWVNDRQCNWADYTTTDIPRLQNHFLEASAIVKSKHVSFLLESGRENLGWYDPLVAMKQFTNAGLTEEDESIPSYCFNWTDSPAIGGLQKQSGLVSQHRKFQKHRRLNKDFATSKITRRHLRDYANLLEGCNKALQLLEPQYTHLIEKYVKSYDYFK